MSTVFNVKILTEPVGVNFLAIKLKVAQSL